MRPPIQIRLANLGDVPILFNMRLAAIRQLSITHLSTLEAASWAAQGGAFRVANAIASDEVWVANRDAQAVGWIHWASNSIEGLYVAPHAARQRIGAALVRFAEHLIAQEGHHRVILKSSPNAMEFYLRLGYAADHIQTSAEVIAMCKQLRPGDVTPP